MVPHLERLDDLRIMSGSHLKDGFTLCAILRNEMYFLPAFLGHYRSLGVERFIFVDDNSDDGTHEYIVGQPDVMTLSSARRYGETVPSPWAGDTRKDVRILYVWRTLMMERFCSGVWSLQVDLDEFIHLPAGQSFPDLVSRPDIAGERSILGVMLDAYPASLSDLTPLPGDAHLDPRARWYFDGEPHLDVSRGERPATLHPGARARLYWKHRLLHANPATRLPLGRRIEYMLARSWLGLRTPRYNTLEKPVLVRWAPGSRYFSSHRTDIGYSRRHLLPILHYRFTGALFRKMEMALRERSYYGNSRDHRLLQALMAEMSLTDQSFLYPGSRLFRNFEDFAATGNAIGLLPE
jgi:hypothetical protein